MSCNRYCLDSRGATMVEMAVVLPLIVFVALGIAEFTFWLTADNLASTAAQRAASFLASAPDIDNECNRCQFPENPVSCNLEKLDCSRRKDEQIDKARNIAQRLLFNTPFFTLAGGERSQEKAFVNVSSVDDVHLSESSDSGYRSGIDIALPVAAPGTSLKTTFQQTPIQVTVCGDRMSFLGGVLSPILGPTSMPRICGQARTWKEPSFINSNAPALDCTGKPITNPASAVKVGCGCLNDDDPFKQATTPGGNKCSCTCNRVREDNGSSGGIVPPNVDCVCPPNMSDPDGDGCCSCEPCEGQLDPASCGCSACPDGTIPDGNGNCQTCPCENGIAHSSDGECTCDICPDGTTPDGSSCVCDASALDCGDGQIAGGDADACVCETCPTNYTPNADQSECVCDTAALECAGNTTPNPTACTCDPCPDGFVPNDTRTACICDVAAVASTCGGSQYVDTETCSCKSCPPGQVPASSGVSCTCPPGSATSCGGSSIYDSSICGCTPCPPGQVATGATTCACPPSALAACAANQTINDQCRCVSCPIPTQVHDTNGRCVCPVAALQTSCGGAEYFDAAACRCRTCPVPQVQTPGNPSSCSCPDTSPCLPGQTRNSSCACTCTGGKSLVSCVDRGGAQACVDATNHCANGNCYCDGYPPE